MATAIRSGAAYRAHLLAPVRGLVLAGLAVLAFLTGVGSIVVATIAGCGLFFLYEPYVRWSRQLTNLCRRLAWRWGGVAIAEPYRPPPPPVRPRPDGWYEHDGRLYRRPTFPTFWRRLAWLSGDPATNRDWLWQVINPAVGGVLALVPAILVLGGLASASVPAVWRATTGNAATAVPLGLATVAVGFAAGPALLRVHALWTRVLLQPVEQAGSVATGAWRWLRRGVTASWHCAAFVGLSVVGVGAALLCVAGLAVGWGWFPAHAVMPARKLTTVVRRFAARWAGVEITQPYRPPPPPPVPGPDGRYQWGRFLYDDPQPVIRVQRSAAVLADPATWRDLAWLVTAPFVSLLVAVAPVVFAVGFFGLVWQPLCWPLWGLPLWWADGTWVTPWYVWYLAVELVPSLAFIPAPVSLLVGAVLTGVGLVFARPSRWLYVRWATLLLAPTARAQLELRIRRLTETRADAVDAQARELRRIERDLHDGAQARLVAMGMTLGVTEQLLDTDPAAARALLAEARETTAKALAELRDLVRGIHPPVLAERGLSDAVRALALDMPINVEVTTDLVGRLPAPLESAAYFAVTELLTNVAKHADAQRAHVDIRHIDGTLRITVTDDGRGGADPSQGSGLRGVERRLGTFDGTLSVASPPGGPTTMTLEVPCVLSSPRTSTSFGTA